MYNIIKQKQKKGRKKNKIQICTISVAEIILFFLTELWWVFGKQGEVN